MHDIMHNIMNVRKSANPHLCSRFHENKRFKHTHRKQIKF